VFPPILTLTPFKVLGTAGKKGDIPLRSAANAARFDP
jgi:hypothetical protein